MGEDIAIKVDQVTKTFKLPHERTNSIKSFVINFWKRKRGYELQKALQNMSFEVKKGEFFGIVGRNGSGKSTMLKMLAGIYSPDSGNIQINGKLTPFIELGVGFSPELTGRENVFLNGSLLGFNRKEMDAMYKDIVEFAELERFMDQKLKNYSSGMQVRLAFSIAIRARSDILLLDEVLAVGDAAFQQKCYDYFEELKEQNKTVVFVSHDMGALKRFCTRAIYVNEGELIQEGKPPEIADLYVADNIEAGQKAAAKIGNKPQGNYQVKVKILDQTKNKVKLEISYSSKEEMDMYMGLSLMKDGVSVAEINSLPDGVVKDSGKMNFTLDTSMLSGGVFQVDAALFKLKTKGLLTFTKEKVRFTVHSPSQGAALRLANTWEKA